MVVVIFVIVGWLVFGGGMKAGMRGANKKNKHRK